MKYMGSKSRIKKEIVPILQKIIDKHNIKTYIEPFVGGCNVIDSIVAYKRLGSDISEPLIELLKHVQMGGELPNEVSKDFYDDVRANSKTSKYEKWMVGAVGFLASYNGRFFDGGYAKNVKLSNGKERDYYQESKRNILNQKNNILDIIFSRIDYRKINNVDNSLIYCDIPYNNTKSYASSKDFDHEAFWEWVREQSKKNIVIVSELNAPDDFVCIWEKEVERTISNTNKFKANEKLFVHHSLLFILT